MSVTGGLWWPREAPPCPSQLTVQRKCRNKPMELDAAVSRRFAVRMRCAREARHAGNSEHWLLPPPSTSAGDGPRCYSDSSLLHYTLIPSNVLSLAFFSLRDAANTANEQLDAFSKNRRLDGLYPGTMTQNLRTRLNVNFCEQLDTSCGLPTCSAAAASNSTIHPYSQLSAFLKAFPLSPRVTTGDVTSLVTRILLDVRVFSVELVADLRIFSTSSIFHVSAAHTTNSTAMSASQTGLSIPQTTQAEFGASGPPLVYKDSLSALIGFLSAFTSALTPMSTTSTCRSVNYSVYSIHAICDGHRDCLNAEPILELYFDLTRFVFILHSYEMHISSVCASLVDAHFAYLACIIYLRCIYSDSQIDLFNGLIPSIASFAAAFLNERVGHYAAVRVCSRIGVNIVCYPLGLLDRVSRPIEVKRRNYARLNREFIQEPRAARALCVQESIHSFKFSLQIILWSSQLVLLLFGVQVEFKTGLQFLPEIAVERYSFSAQNQQSIDFNSIRLASIIHWFDCFNWILSLWLRWAPIEVQKPSETVQTPGLCPFNSGLLFWLKSPRACVQYSFEISEHRLLFGVQVELEQGRQVLIFHSSPTLVD
ncbi:hypothetical protein R3P38DRAFT_2816185 [Favolaschia claudopus]|uniref:Uncharacterized protein n=1 Tax=Favolaschia claudopus TaxID=2862362 RepID=A0AAV9YZJ1_9AGAR